jgi:hypothetical protein
LRPALRFLVRWFIGHDGAKGYRTVRARQPETDRCMDCGGKRSATPLSPKDCASRITPQNLA